MEPQEKLTTHQFITDRLHDVQRKTEAGRIQDALAELKEVKAADTKNIYTIALEKQITKLTELNLGAENRTEILKSLPAMVERAINDANRRISVERPPEVKDTKEKEAALEKLKSQYFQRADDYVSKRDYVHALEEIRRIYIIEPGSVVAKEYEQKIEQLSAIQVKAEQTKESEKEPKHAEQPKEAASAKAGKSKIPMIAAVVAVVAIGAGAWFFFSHRSHPAQESTQQQQQEVAQTETTTPQTTTPPPAVEEKTPEPTKTVAEEPTKQPEVTPVETKPAVAKPVERRRPEPKPVYKPPVQRTQPKQTRQPEQQPAKPISAPVQTPVQQPPPQQQPQQTQPQPQQAQPQQQQTQQAAPPPQQAEVAAPRPFNAIETPPQLTKRATPTYPEIAYRMRIEGRVIVEVTVDSQGKPVQAKVVRSASEAFNDAAIEAAMKSSYTPAMMSTGPVTAKVYVPFDFKLR